VSEKVDEPASVVVAPPTIGYPEEHRGAGATVDRPGPNPVLAMLANRAPETGPLLGRQLHEPDETRERARAPSFGWSCSGLPDLLLEDLLNLVVEPPDVRLLDFPRALRSPEPIARCRATSVRRALADALLAGLLGGQWCKY
jgi:hypothetical protein